MVSQKSSQHIALTQKYSLNVCIYVINQLLTDHRNNKLPLSLPQRITNIKKLSMIRLFFTQAASMGVFIRGFTANKRTHGANNGPGKANQDPDTMAVSRSELLQSQMTESI